MPLSNRKKVFLLAVKLITHIKRYIGASTDVKPTGDQPGTIFYETDTGDEYIYDGSAWHLKQDSIL